MTHHPHLGDNATRDHVYKCPLANNTIFMDVNWTFVKIYGCDRALKDLQSLEQHLSVIYPGIDVGHDRQQTVASQLSESGKRPYREYEYALSIPVYVPEFARTANGDMIYNPRSAQYQELRAPDRRANDVAWRKLRDSMTDDIDAFIISRGYQVTQKGTHFATLVRDSQQSATSEQAR